jgi:hypothetical protein
MSEQPPSGYPVPEPRPRWGEYAPAQPPAQQPLPQQTYAPWPYAVPPKPPRRIWDIVLTSILLVVGLFGTLIACLYAANLQRVVEIAAEQRGISANGASTSVESLVIVISHVVLLLAAAGISIPLLVRGRPVAFWIPLAAGVIAAILFWVLLIIAVGSNFSVTDLQRIGAGG